MATIVPSLSIVIGMVEDKMVSAMTSKMVVNVLPRTKEILKLLLVQSCRTEIRNKYIAV